MKLVTFDAGRVGRLVDDTVVELDCSSTREYFERGGEVAETGERLALAQVRLRAPIVPKKFFHTAGNFAAHHEELAAVNWSHPVHKGIVFFQNVDAIIGPDDAVVYPEGLTDELDYELELAVVIGKTGKWFGPDEADDHIAGYTIFNDITARDIQRREMESGVFSFSKAIDTFCPIGPWIVTADEIDDPHALAMELTVNGQVRQKGNTDQLRLTLQQLVAYHSPQGYSAGDLITTGTISGVAAVQPDPFACYLRPGDVMEASIEGLGVLRNRVAAWSEAHDGPPPSNSPVRFASLAGRLVLLADNGAVDVGRASGGNLPADPLAALARWPEVRAWAASQDLARLAEPVGAGGLGAPVPQPRQVFAVALNYRPHATEAGFSAPDEPLVFTKFASCIAGSDTTVTLPPGKVDWEVEVVAVIGSGGRDLPADTAWDAVAGLAIGQDLSERVLQLTGTPAQFSLGKSYAGFGPVGPAVTPDALADRDDLGFTCTLDGETVQAGRTSEMIFPVAELVSRLSRVVELLPGDLVFTGTPAGVGNRRTPPRYLQSGEVLVSTAEGLGAIRQTFA